MFALYVYRINVVTAAVSLEALQGNGTNGYGYGNVSLPITATAVYGVTVINGDNVNL